METVKPHATTCTCTPTRNEAKEPSKRQITHRIGNSVRQGNWAEYRQRRRREHNLDAMYQDAFACIAPLFGFVLFFSKKKAEQQTISKSKQQIVSTVVPASQMEELLRRRWWQLYYILFMIIGANLRYLARKTKCSFGKFRIIKV